MSNEPPKESQQSSRSPAEWVSFNIALCILTTIVGLVLYSWLTGEDQPPVLSVKLEGEIRQVEGQFYVPFTVSNTGGRTVESVQVVAQLRVDGEVEEAGEQQVDFLSSGETIEGAFIFSSKPSEGEIIVRAASYKLP